MPKKEILFDIYEKIVGEVDKNGRQYSEMFMELPAKEEYPDYYEVIGDPIALDMIKERIEDGQVKSVRELASDLKLMFDNARTYNEKGSLVYKDAAHLDKLLRQNIDDLSNSAQLEDEDADLLVEVFDQLVADKTIVDGEVAVEPFLQLPDEEEYPEYYDVIRQPISLAEIKSKIDSKEYRTVYDMEEDLVLMIDNARTFNESGSFVYEAAGKVLDRFYALSGIERDHVKFEEQLEEVQHDSVTYRLGDFAYFASDDDDNSTGKKKAIGQIYKIWKNKSGEVMIQANWFLRPEQTVHPAGRRFYEKEVFKWDKFVEHVQADLMGKCIVLHVRDYVRGRPEGWESDDLQSHVYICESRYLEQAKKMDKIKNWRLSQPNKLKGEELKMTQLFDTPLQLEKFPSPFANSGADGGVEADHGGDLKDEAVGDQTKESSTKKADEQQQPVKRKRGRPRKDEALKMQEQLQKAQIKKESSSAGSSSSSLPLKSSARIQQLQQQQQMLKQQQLMQQQQQQQMKQAKQQAAPSQQQSEFQKMQMRNYAMYQQQQKHQQMQQQQPMMNWLSNISMQAQAARALQPPNRQHRVTRSISSVVRQTAADSMPPETLKKFRQPGPNENRICWFTSPPLFLPPPQQPGHSSAYVQWRMKQKDQDQTGNNTDVKVVKKRKLVQPTKALINWERQLDDFQNQMIQDAHLISLKL